MIDKLTELAKIQTSAIQDLDIDKVVVYDNGSGQGVGNFVQGLYGMMPQLSDFLEQSGMSLPKALTEEDEEEAKIETIDPVAQPKPSSKPNNTNNPNLESKPNKEA